jgi:hypothetical protein
MVLLYKVVGKLVKKKDTIDSHYFARVDSKASR